MFTQQSSTLKDVCKKDLIKIRQNWMDILILVKLVMQPMYYVVILTANVYVKDPMPVSFDQKCLNFTF